MAGQERWNPSWQLIEQAPGTDCCGAAEGERCRIPRGTARSPHAARKALAVKLGYYTPEGENAARETP